MEIFLDCLPCLLKQSLEAARRTTDDESIHCKVVDKALSYLTDYKSYKNAPDLAVPIHKAVKEYTHSYDPYSSIKARDLESARKLCPYVMDFVKEKENDLYWVMKMAATGNNLDAAIYDNVDMKKCIDDELTKPFILCDIDLMKEKISKAKTLLIIGDNTGESIFDKAMIDCLPKNIEITYAVRNQPIINDVTKDDAIASGIDKVARIVSTGCNAPGAILSQCSNEFLKIYNSSDVIISKGQGNYEAMSEDGKNTFFLLKAKCPIIARRFNVPLNSYICKYLK